MEIFSHGLWAAAGATAINRRKTGVRLSVAGFAAWALFPDLFAFGPRYILQFWNWIDGADLHYRFSLYRYSHSLVIFAAVWGLVWLLRRRPAWAMLGWALHVAMDIPSHGTRYPTPFLWPVSDYRFIGIQWHGWLIPNWVALGGVFLVLLLTRRRKPKTPAAENDDLRYAYRAEKR